MSSDGHRPATRVVHAGQPAAIPGEPLLPGPVFAAPFHLPGDVDSAPYGYGRYGNPTFTNYETALGELERGTATLFSSGMAASAAVLVALTRPGDVVVVPADCYGAVRTLCDDTSPRAGSRSGSSRPTRSSWRRRRRGRASSGPRRRATRPSTSSTSRRSRGRPGRAGALLAVDSRRSPRRSRSGRWTSARTSRRQRLQSADRPRRPHHGVRRPAMTALAGSCAMAQAGRRDSRPDGELARASLARHPCVRLRRSRRARWRSGARGAGRRRQACATRAFRPTRPMSSPRGRCTRPLRLRGVLRAARGAEAGGSWPRDPGRRCDELRRRQRSRSAGRAGDGCGAGGLHPRRAARASRTPTTSSRTSQGRSMRRRVPASSRAWS